ncbi:N-acetyltransferase family protein [Ferruginibacter sp.]
MQDLKSINSEKNLKPSESTQVPSSGGDLGEAVIIRRAVKEDCARMMELINELAVYEKAPDEVTVDFNHFVESGFGENPVWWAFVAEVDGRVEGFALWYIRYSTWKGQRLYLEDLLVTEKMRGKGIGKLLFDKLIEECKAKQYSGMMWQVLDWNEPAINFYKKYPDVNIDSGWLNCNINF